MPPPMRKVHRAGICNAPARRKRFLESGFDPERARFYSKAVEAGFGTLRVEARECLGEAP